MDFVFSKYFRYFFFFVTLFFIILAFNVYRSNLLVDLKIKATKDQISLEKQKIYFNKLYFSNFLESKWSKILYAHSNGIPLKGEKVFVLNKVDIDNFRNKKKEKEKKITNYIIWKQFLIRKFEKIIDN
jgi:hypothetical protein